MRLKVDSLIGKRTIIIGDVGRGKTLLTLRIIKKLRELGFSNEITILDFAPSKILMGDIEAGGKLTDFGMKLNGINYYSDTIAAPRLTGRNVDEIIRLAQYNRVKCEALLLKFLENPTPILVINDITLYFQVGSLGLLPKVLGKASTFIANGYFGKSLKEDLGSGISRNERLMMMKLINFSDYVINLNEVDRVEVDS